MEKEMLLNCGIERKKTVRSASIQMWGWTEEWNAVRQ